MKLGGKVSLISKIITSLVVLVACGVATQHDPNDVRTSLVDYAKEGLVQERRDYYDLWAISMFTLSEVSPVDES